MENSADLTYMGRPLVRKGQEIYYGSMTDKYVIHLNIVSDNKVIIQLEYTDPDIKGSGKIVKTAERSSLGEAMEISSAWLAKNNK
ncbi:MAG: hypothetical protein LBL82_02815 [Oscillospiraceae bacterium]|jgi:hypothetical protein|nr:hypothetical protein [Oscillospiraceae bacterium]